MEELRTTTTAQDGRACVLEHLPCTYTYSSHQFPSKARWYINPLFVFLRILSQTGSFVLLSHDEHRGVERAKQRRAGHFIVRRRRVSLFGIRSWCGFVVIALVLGFFDSRLRLRGGLRDYAVDAVDHAVGRLDVGHDNLVPGDEDIAVGGLVDLDGVPVEGGDLGGELHGENVGGGVFTCEVKEREMFLSEPKKPKKSPRRVQLEGGCRWVVSGAYLRPRGARGFT